MTGTVGSSGPGTAPSGAESSSGRKLHRAARVEDAVHARIERRVSEKGWVPAITGYTGYGTPGWARVMARVLMTRPDPRKDRPAELVRGWRSFVTVPRVGAEVVLRAGGGEQHVTTDRSGYIDVVFDCDLEPGWREVVLSTEGGEDVAAPILVVDPEATTGLVSDVDDTVMVTTLPRAVLAAWNTFVLNEHARRPVPGMAVLFERWSNANTKAPVIYLSTGAWNVAPTLTRFLSRHLYPRGPLLLTDWGPTREGWFRSGRLHKRASLERLVREFPKIRWLLVGDDGQHDPDIYSNFARSHRNEVSGVVIRHLSPTEQVLASGLPVPMDEAQSVPGTPWITGPDGAAIAERLRQAGLL